MEIALVKVLHIVSSTLLFGTGIGSAFYLFFTTLTRDVAAIATVTRLVVRADWMFTATTLLVQPATGLYLLHHERIPLQTPWVMWSLFLFAMAAACWLPVVVIQMRLRDLAAAAHRDRTGLPADYWRYFGAWVALGIPALICFLAIFYLMVVKTV